MINASVPWSAAKYVCLGFMLLGICAADGGAASATSGFDREIYLIRHGAYDSASTSTADPGLTPLGIAQARLVAARLRGYPDHWDSITSSTMARAKETAVVIRETLPGVPMQQDPLLSECTPPTASASAVNKRDPDESAKCATQLDKAFNRYFIPASGAVRRDLLVCHGNVIRYFVMKALGVDTKAWLAMDIAQTSLTIIRIRRDGSIIVLGVGDVGHIPSNMQSWGGKSDPQLVAEQ
jgi:serine/threonine-protein phosphatase PGAM5